MHAERNEMYQFESGHSTTSEADLVPSKTVFLKFPFCPLTTPLTKPWLTVPSLYNQPHLSPLPFTSFDHKSSLIQSQHTEV
ncbi:hypothetical protein L2E82_33438 [Cichorium intybus]|uniref:Uncharacterized protein n=1 Tax=Cichorium intybus TaxID=13427 RepID=A0ACB9BK49_CICIN|nr:hypothetical protein L2E82_33438 [Cichorium intybus]